MHKEVDYAPRRSNASSLAFVDTDASIGRAAIA